MYCIYCGGDVSGFGEYGVCPSCNPLSEFNLRDFFAGLAMQKHMEDDGGAPTTSIAKWAYEQADAMMKGRQTYDKTSDRGIKGEG